MVIVSFNTKDKLRRCLGCLDFDRHEVIVVDNASSDGSAQMVQTEFPAAKLIESDVNLGFSAGNNLGVASATGDLILYLNSDAYAKPEAIERLASVFADSSISTAGGKVLNLDGSLQESVAGRLTLGKVFLEQTYLDGLARKLGGGYWRTWRLPTDRVSEVDQVMGACLITRRSYGEQFNERFFLYCEDTELCLRLAKHGKIVYVPDAEFEHELGSSSSGNRWLAVARYNLGKELYFRIHQGSTAAAVCWMMNRFGAFLRVLAGVVSPAKAKIFVKVLFAKSSELGP